MEANLLLLIGIGFVALVAGWQNLSVGFLALPVLLIFLPDLFTQVQPYALALSAGTALVILVISRRELNLDWKIAIILGGNAALAASLVALLSYSLIDHGCMIMGFFGYSFLLFYGTYSLSSESTSRPNRFLLVFSATTVTGIFSGLLGVGAGYILLPILLFSGMERKRSVAISAFVELFASIFALLPRLSVAQWDISLLIWLMGTSIVGACIGMYLSRYYRLNRKIRIVLFIGLSGLVLYAAREVIQVCPTFQSIG
jgi:uncharacterized membrane protein YfcA